VTQPKILDFSGEGISTFELIPCGTIKYFVMSQVKVMIVSPKYAE